MLFDMEYDGQTLFWSGMGSFRATSGLPGFQEPKYQCAADSGPLPEGFYAVLLADKGGAVDDGTGACALKPAWGIQSIPRGESAGSCEPYWANWGLNRARIEPTDAATKTACMPIRGGFYLHDSTKGFSHGCIETETRLFPLLNAHHKTTRKNSLVLRIKYVPGRKTYGNTKI